MSLCESEINMIQEVAFGRHCVQKIFHDKLLKTSSPYGALVHGKVRVK
jgi:hypothetical protein